VHLALSPRLDSPLTDDQRELLSPIATELGADALGRMLGLWVEQEPLLKEAANRELALEAAALRLARWPAVRQVEQLLSGSGGGAVTPPSAPDSPPAAAPGDGGGVGGGPQNVSSGGRDTAAADSGQPAHPAEQDLEDRAERDPQLQLVLKVLGGEVVGVRPDRETG
jgi:hypothetical protein